MHQDAQGRHRRQDIWSVMGYSSHHKWWATRGLLESIGSEESLSRTGALFIKRHMRHIIAETGAAGVQPKSNHNSIPQYYD